MSTTPQDRVTTQTPPGGGQVLSAAPDHHRIPPFPFPTSNPPGPAPAPASPAHERPPQPISLLAVRPEHLQPVYSHLILLGNELHALYTAVCQMRDEIAGSHALTDIEDTWTLGTNIPATKLDYHGKRHLLLYAAAAQTVSETVDGLGTRTITLTVGWNVVDGPQGAKYSLTSATPVYLRVRYTNDVAPGLK